MTVCDKVCQEVASISSLLSCDGRQSALAEDTPGGGWSVFPVERPSVGRYGGSEKGSLCTQLPSDPSYQSGTCLGGVLCCTSEGRGKEGGREGGGKPEAWSRWCQQRTDVQGGVMARVPHTTGWLCGVARGWPCPRRLPWQSSCVHQCVSLTPWNEGQRTDPDIDSTGRSEEPRLRAVPEKGLCFVRSCPRGNRPRLRFPDCPPRQIPVFKFDNA